MLFLDRAYQHERSQSHKQSPRPPKPAVGIRKALRVSRPLVKGNAGSGYAIGTWAVSSG